MLLAAAVGGVAGEVAKAVYQSTVQRLVDRYFARHAPTARASAETNTLDFLARLALRLDSLEQRTSSAGDSARIQQALDDPDAAFVFEQAVLTSARTNSESRHDILARAVAARLAAPSDSARAFTSNQAVEAIRYLAAEHLEALGLLALIHSVRPRSLIPPDVANDSDVIDWSPAAREAGQLQARDYANWFRAQREFYALPLRHVESILSHLVGVSCIVYERTVYRNLTRSLWPRRNPEAVGRNTPFFSALSYELGMVPHDFIEGSSRFASVWDSALEHVLLTPAGALIGLAVHSQRSGVDYASEWEWMSPELQRSSDVVDNEVWDGHHFNRKFLEALDKEIKDRAERGVPPWRNLDK